MTIQRHHLLLLFCLIGSIPLARAESCPSGQHPRFSIAVARELATQPLSGRLVVLMSSGSSPAEKLEPSFGPEAHSVWIAAKEVHGVTSQAPVEFDPEDLAYPAPFCTAPAGNYKMKAVLDIDHNIAYTSDASDGDLLGTVEQQNFDPASDQKISLTLNSRKADPPLQLPANTEEIDFISRKLSAFWGWPIHMRGLVVLPPGYAASKHRYPTVYITHGFGGDMKYLVRNATNTAKLMTDKKTPKMIWVLLLEATPSGTHEFADGVNNGPWGTALTTELIPHLEKKYRMDAKPTGRLITGHSSGGWAAMWIQVSHPAFFGGTWPTAPDPVDFRSFAGADLTRRPPPNFYYKDDGSPRMLMRMGGKDTQSMPDLALQERVLGAYGGQLSSFQWVFGPRGPDGRAMPMFNPDTGAIDPEVVEYWDENYNIAGLLRKNWKQLGPLLNGKIHLTVGTADTFHLDEPAKLLEQTIKQLGGRASFTYVEGCTHFDLYQGGELTIRIANEMYAVARPQASPKKSGPRPPSTLENKHSPRN